MQVRGHDLNWFDLMRDAALFHESEFAAGMQALKEKHNLKSGIGRLDGAFLYCLTRWIKPKVIVETGTYYGMSARYMIQALIDEGIDGKLYSIDIDEADYVGSVVTGEHAEYFVRVTGSSDEVMRQNTIPEPIDLFFHDSIHRYDYQLAEFRSFWEKLRSGGLLVSHDVNKNAAFSDFVSSTYKHSEKGYAAEDTGHSFWGAVASTGWIQKT